MPEPPARLGGGVDADPARAGSSCPAPSPVERSIGAGRPMPTPMTRPRSTPASSRTWSTNSAAASRPVVGGVVDVRARARSRRARCARGRRRRRAGGGGRSRCRARRPPSRLSETITGGRPRLRLAVGGCAVALARRARPRAGRRRSSRPSSGRGPVIRASSARLAMPRSRRASITRLRLPSRREANEPLLLTRRMNYTAEGVCQDFARYFRLKPSFFVRLSALSPGASSDNGAQAALPKRDLEPPEHPAICPGTQQKGSDPLRNRLAG